MRGRDPHVNALRRASSTGALVSATARLTVYGEPAPKGSRTAGTRRDGTRYTRPACKREHDWTEAVASQARWLGTQLDGLPAAPYAVELTFYLTRPARPAHAYPSRTDLDKLARCTLDGLVRGGVLTDDRHVIELRACKRWATAPGGECASIEVATAEVPSCR